MIVAEVGRVKFTYGERHIIEDPAGIILVGYNAFLVGNGVFGRVDEILRGADNTNDREDTDRNDKFPFVMIAVTEMSVYADRDALGNILATATAATRIALVLFNYLGRKNDRVNDFCNCPLIAKVCLIRRIFEVFYVYFDFSALIYGNLVDNLSEIDVSRAL